MTIKAMEQQLINLGFTKTVSKKIELGMTITNIYFELPSKQLAIKILKFGNQLQNITPFEKWDHQKKMGYEVNGCGHHWCNKKPEVALQIILQTIKELMGV